MIWQTDAFALAAGYDDSAGRYIVLWTPEDNGPAAAATDSLLLVRPDIAVQQRDAEDQGAGPARPAGRRRPRPSPPSAPSRCRLSQRPRRRTRHRQSEHDGW
nr:hypothetical protein [Frankia sp. CiP3]